MKNNLNLERWIYPCAIRAGAKILKPLVIHPAREKAHGRMWDGSAEVELNGRRLSFDVWYHGEDEETTGSIAEKGTSLRFIDGEDAHWCVLVKDGHLFLHETGWWSDEELDQAVSKASVEELGKMSGMHLLLTKS